VATPAEIKKWKQKGRDEVEEGLPGWFGTFADMMTLLFAFFVLLAAISTIDPVKLQEMADGMGKSVGKKKKLENQSMTLADVKKAAQEMVEEMEADPETGEKPVEVTTGPRGVTIGISSDISFGSGSSNLKGGIIPVLQGIVPTIQSSYFMVAVEGHTDTDQLPVSFQDKFPSNWELSGARAAAVVRELVKLGVEPTRLQAVGFAEYIPRDRPTDRVINDALIREFNATTELKARNRRVEITFLASGLKSSASKLPVDNNEEE
jgi:chemotaxis protein MotB|tara:strand:+ start:247 stop:1035 length:789 start_codon:yes stop_codon:yes gene_type:complete